MRIRMGRHKTAVPPKLPPAKQRQGLSFTPLTRANGCGCALCPSEIHRTKRLTAPAPKRQRPPVRAGFHLSRLSSGRPRSPRPLPLRTPRGRTLPHGILRLFDYISCRGICQTNPKAPRTYPKLMPMRRATVSISHVSGTSFDLPAMSLSGFSVTMLFFIATATP